MPEPGLSNRGAILCYILFRSTNLVCGVWQGLLRLPGEAEGQCLALFEVKNLQESNGNK